MGLTLDKFDLTNNDSMLLSQLMQRILDDKRWAAYANYFHSGLYVSSYALSAARMADAYSDKLVSSEHALDHTLRLSQKPAIQAFTRSRHAIQMHFIQYYCLDVIFVWSSLAMILVYIVLRVVFAFSRMIFGSRK